MGAVVKATAANEVVNVLVAVLRIPPSSESSSFSFASLRTPDTPHIYLKKNWGWWGIAGKCDWVLTVYNGHVAAVKRKLSECRRDETQYEELLRYSLVLLRHS